jgi:hypothetical protein
MLLTQLLPCIFLHGSLVLHEVCGLLTHPFEKVITNVLSTTSATSPIVSAATSPIVSAATTAATVSIICIEKHVIIIVIPVYTSAIKSGVFNLATIVLSSLSLCNTLTHLPCCF